MIFVTTDARQRTKEIFIYLFDLIYFLVSEIGSGAYGTPPAGIGGGGRGVASASAITAQNSALGPLSHEMAGIRGQNLVVVG